MGIGKLFRIFWDKGYVLSQKKPRYDKDDLLKEFNDNIFWILLNGIAYLGISIGLIISLIFKSYVPFFVSLLFFGILVIICVIFYSKLSQKFLNILKGDLYEIFKPTDRLIVLLRKTSYFIFFLWIFGGVILQKLYGFNVFISIYWGMLVFVYLGIDRLLYPNVALIYFILNYYKTNLYKQNQKRVWVLLILTSPIWYVTTILFFYLLYTTSI